MKPELFIPRTQRLSFATDPTPKARVFKAGMIALNATALKLLTGGVAEPKFVLYFYQDLGQIGLRSFKSGDPSEACFKPTYNAKDGTARLRAKALFTHYGIDLEKAAGVYVVGFDDKNALSVIPLPKGSCPVMVDSSAVRARLRAKALFTHYGIDLEKAAGVYVVGFDDKNALSVIPLPKGSCPVMVDSSAVRARLREAGQRAGAA